MDKDVLINLTNKVYQLTLLFPKKEPLRYKMREVADDILAKSAANPKTKNEILEEIKILDNFFELAKLQNWVKREKIIEVQKEYEKTKEELKTIAISQKIDNVISLPPVKDKIQPILTNLTNGDSRRKMIIELLKEKDKIQVWEVKKVLPEVTKRTIRRDFENLLKQGLIERIGERNNTYYRLIGQ